MNAAPAEHSSFHGPIIFGSAILTLGALYWGRELFIPLALATFLSFVLAPIVKTLERIRIGRVPSVVIVVTATVGSLAGIGWVVASQASELAKDFQRYRYNITSKIQDLQSSIIGAAGPISGAIDAISESVRTVAPESTKNGEEEPTVGPLDQEDKPLKVEVVPKGAGVLLTVRQFVNPLVYPLATASVTMLFVVFFLIYREDLRDRIIRMFGRTQMNVTTTALMDVVRRVTRYVVALAAANGFVGMAVGGGLFFLGVPHAELWGLLAALLRFVPFVGVFIAAVFPVAQAVAVFDGWWQPMFVLAWILLFDILSANFMEPWLFGTQTGASPTALLFAFVLWTWLWGGIGLVLATPITVCLVVLGKHIPGLEFLYILLSDEPVLEPQARFYQRLLARDRREAIRVVQGFASDHSLIAVCEQIVLPALAQLESDRRSGFLESARVDFARNTTLDVLAVLGSSATAKKPESPTNGAAQKIAVVLDRGAFDTLIPPMLAAVSGIPEARLNVLTSDRLATEIVEGFRAEPPSAIVLAAIEPRDASRFRSILKRLALFQTPASIPVALFSIAKQLSRVELSSAAGRPLPGPDLTELADMLRGIAGKNNLN